MKNLILLLFFIPVFAIAQKAHTVAAKETLYSLGRQYNIHPKELAAYNNISIGTGLVIGQVIKIPSKGVITPIKNDEPAKATVVSKKTAAKSEVADAGSEPVYHKVEKKESLYRISKLYKNISVEDIKKWNHLTSDGLSEGTNLIVGYQKTKKGAVISPVVITEKYEAKEVVPAVTKPLPEKVKQSEVEPVVAVTQTKVVPVAKPAEPMKPSVSKTTEKKGKGGYFKTMYEEQSQKKRMVEENGTAAIFKSTSGWEDGKYYCLHNSAPSGAIVKITNSITQKSIYAKVLDVIPDLKQNAGIMIRLSNAAADELGAGESNFDSVITY